jgi:hypothetical protein
MTGNEAHGTNGTKSVSVSYMLCVVRLCPNLVGMNSLHISDVNDLHWHHQIRQCSTQLPSNAPRHSNSEKSGFADVGVLGAACWLGVFTNAACGDISAVHMDGVDAVHFFVAQQGS